MKEKPIIFVSISSGIILRNFGSIPDNVIDQLQKEAKVVLIVPDSAYNSILQKYKDDENIQVESLAPFYPLKLTFIQSVFLFFVKHLKFTEGAQLFSYYGVRLDSAPSFFNRILYFIKLFISKTFGKVPWIRVKFAPYLDTFFFKNRKDVIELFEKYDTALVFLPNIQHEQDLAILREAKRRKIFSVGMPGSWDHLPKWYLPIKPERLLVWHEHMKEEAIYIQDYDESKITITGSPYYDILARKDFILSREEFLSSFGFDTKKKLIFFASGGVYAPDDSDVVDMIVKAMHGNSFEMPIQLYVRPYPGVEIEHKKFDVFENKKNVFIDWIAPSKAFGDPWLPSLDDIKRFVNFLYHSDVIINTTSSIAIEASVFLKPIINIGFDGYKDRPYGKSLKRFDKLEHYKPVYESNGVYLVEDRTEFIPIIKKCLHKPCLNKSNTEHLQKYMCGPLDGKTSKRIVGNIIISLPEKS